MAISFLPLRFLILTINRTTVISLMKLLKEITWRRSNKNRFNRFKVKFSLGKILKITITMTFQSSYL